MKAEEARRLAVAALTLVLGARAAAQEIARAGAAPRTMLAPAAAAALAPSLSMPFAPSLSALAPSLATGLAPLAAALPAVAQAAPAAPAAAAPAAPELAAVQKLADDTGLTWLVGAAPHAGAGAPSAGAGLALGAVGGGEELARAAAAPWDSVPGARRPELSAASAEDAAGRGLLAVAPRAAQPGGRLGYLSRAAAPLRTTEQLARLARAPRADGEAFRFAVIGDAEPGRFWIWRALFNDGKDAFWRLLRRADRQHPDFIVQLGDMVSRGAPRNFRDFLRRLLDARPNAPYLTVIGNHDRRSPHGVSDDRVYRAIFGGTDYYFDRGGRRFVVADTSAGRLTAEQMDWLRRVVEAGRPTIVFTHMPPAPLGEWTDYGRLRGAGGFKEGAVEFMRLMSERRVERVYVGHVHGLGVLDRGGVRYVLSGGGGSPLYPGPVKRRLHHLLDVSVGPDGIEETVRPLSGRPFTLR